MTAAVRIDGLGVTRGKPVLEGISADIPAGSITGLLGPSGSGKTTLMRAIIGVQRISSGSIDVLGVPAGTASLRSRIGYVSQSPSVYDDLSVRANVGYFASIYGHGRSDVESVIEAVDMREFAETRVSSLSGGQQSRVSLACALTCKPEVLILDEPTVGLDPVLRADLWSTFAGLAADGVTLFVSSHVMDEAAHCSRLLLLRGGRLLADTTADELTARTGSDDLDEAFLRLITDSVPDGGTVPPGGEPATSVPDGGTVPDGGGRHRGVAR